MAASDKKAASLDAEFEKMVKAWRRAEVADGEGDFSVFQRTLDHLLEQNAVSDRMSSAIQVLGRNFGGFAIDVERHACSLYFPMEAQTSGLVELFAVPVTASGDTLDFVLNDDKVREKLEDSFSQSGLFHRDSLTVVLPVALDPMAVAVLQPEQLRLITEAFMEAAVSGNMRLLSEVTAMLRLRRGRVTRPNSFGTHMVIGGRLLIESGEEKYDFLTPAEGEADRLEAVESWHSAAEAAVDLPQDDKLQFGVPDEWGAASSALGITSLFTTLQWEAAMRMVPPQSWNCATGHACQRENYIYLMAEIGTVWVGPARVPVALFMADPEYIREDLAQGFSTLKWYFDPADMPTGLAPGRVPS